MSSVGLAGDWHGDGKWAIHMLKAFKEKDQKDIYHLGDFGLSGNRFGTKYIKSIDGQLEMYGQTIKVTPGNHEDYVLLNSIPVSEKDGLQWLTERIAFMPRGYRWEIDGTRFASLGGAASIDYTTRKKGINWWAEEAITTGDVYRLSQDGETDILLTHEAPLGIKKLDEIKAESHDDWLDVELAYSEQSQTLMTYAVEAVRPKILFHGHFHTGYREDVMFVDANGEGFVTAVHGLNMNGRVRNIGTLDCETLQFNWDN